MSQPAGMVDPLSHLVSTRCTTRENVTATTEPINPAYYEPTAMEKFERFFEELSWKIRRSIDRSLEAHKKKKNQKKRVRRGSDSEYCEEKTEYWVEEFEIIGADELEEKRRQSEEPQNTQHAEPKWISTSTMITGGAEKPRRKSTGNLLQFLTSSKSSSSPSSPSAPSPPSQLKKPKRRVTWKF